MLSKPKSFFVTLVLVLTALTSKAQVGEGVVKFLVDVDNGYFEILINDTLYLKNYKTNLPAGTHTAKVWSPGYITTEVSFDVKPGETTEQYVKMAISNERQDFEKKYAAYRMKFHKSLTIPASVTLFSALTTTTFMVLAYDKRKSILKDVDSYHASPTYKEVEFYKERIEIDYKKYNNYRASYYVAGALTTLSLVTTIFTYTKFKRTNTEPVLNAESPFKDRFSLQITPVSFGLT
ncbi:MAG: hypothetical protein ACI857_003415, partial [Arenicella sp.]